MGQAGSLPEGVPPENAQATRDEVLLRALAEDHRSRPRAEVNTMLPVAVAVPLSAPHLAPHVQAQHLAAPHLPPSHIGAGGPFPPPPTPAYPYPPQQHAPLQVAMPPTVIGPDGAPITPISSLQHNFDAMGVARMSVANPTMWHLQQSQLGHLAPPPHQVPNAAVLLSATTAAAAATACTTAPTTAETTATATTTATTTATATASASSSFSSSSSDTAAAPTASAASPLLNALSADDTAAAADEPASLRNGPAELMSSQLSSDPVTSTGADADGMLDNAAMLHSTADISNLLDQVLSDSSAVGLFADALGCSAGVSGGAVNVDLKAFNDAAGTGGGTVIGAAEAEAAADALGLAPEGHDGGKATSGTPDFDSVKQRMTRGGRGTAEDGTCTPGGGCDGDRCGA